MQRGARRAAERRCKRYERKQGERRDDADRFVMRIVRRSGKNTGVREPFGCGVAENGRAKRDA